MKMDDLVKLSRNVNAKKLENLKYIKNLNIGILGGTFDPIHYGHLSTAEYIKGRYELDKIIFIPSGNPPHKLNIETVKYDRYNMVLLATYNNDDFIVLDNEIKKDEKSYTVDTLEYIKKEYDLSYIYFITGTDVICSIEEWKNVKKDFELAKFITPIRPGTSLIKAQEKIDYLSKKYGADISTVFVPSLDISSTFIREQLGIGKSIRYLVPESVDKYLHEKNMYTRR